MKPIHEFLAELDRHQIKFKIEGQQLRVRSAQHALTPVIAQELHVRKEEILQFLSRRRAALTPPALQAAARPESLPLSYAQERLWFLAQLEGPGATYNIPFALRLCGALDATALRAALQGVIQRHEILRTTFATCDGVARQVAAPAFDAGLPIVDLRGVAEPEREGELQRQLKAAAAQPFDLAVGPLLRAALYRLAGEEHILLLTLHHIVADGWSLGILLRELSEAYGAILAGKPPPLAPLPYQYADFAIWQRRHLQGEFWSQQLSWWQQQLRNAPTILDLPADYPRPPIQGSKADTVAFTLDSVLTVALDDLSRQAGVSLFMTMFTAFAVLLMRYTGQEDMIIGTPIANRHHRELEPLIGFFVNTLPLRVDLSGNPSFPELLQRVRQVTLDAYAHQDVPFEQLVNHLPVERSLSHSPLFQVMMSVEYASSYPAVEPQPFADLTARRVEVEQVFAQCDLNLQIVKAGARLKGWLDYSAELFQRDTVAHLLRHYRNVLAEIVSNPAQTVWDLQFLDAEESRRLLDEFNPIQRDYPSNLTLHELFEEQAARCSGNVAIVDHRSRFRYGELNVRGNRIAHLLREIGIDPGQTVGILDNRGCDLLAALLGILKAGGAFLPLDPEYPEERIRYMVADSQISTLITRRTVIEKFASALSATTLRCVLVLDSGGPIAGTPDWMCWYTKEQLGRCCTENPDNRSTSGDVAYLLYTSGSTGLPKGAAVRHNGAINHIYGEFELLSFDPNSVFLQSAPCSSDISVWQFLAPVLIGGRVVVADFETVCNPARLFDRIRDEDVTLIELVPVVLRTLLDHVESLPRTERALPDLKCAMVTGESVSVSLINAWLEHYPNIPIVNAYGPTEAADDVCQYAITAPFPADSQTVPIGKPLPNVWLYVLDRNLRLVPIGVPGEICISGIAVGNGYWNDTEKTKRSFVPNPYADPNRGDILYRTGDLGRWLPDGNLAYLGRLDEQVKLRGFRIEPGEIEALLVQHPAVQDAIVVLHKAGNSEPRLVAYIVVEKDQTQPDMSGLREYLRNKLPGYMIPAAFIGLDSLPLSPNGKVDRRALPTPDLSMPVTAFARPRTLTEQNLVAVWREVLRAEAVGIHDNFFDLGGHSLLAVRLLAQIRQLCGRPLPLPILFQYPTVAALGTYLDRAEPISWSTFVALQPNGTRAPFFCLPGDGGNVFYFYPLVRAMGNERPFYGLESVGLDGRTPPHATVEEAAAYQIAELKRCFPQGPYLLGGHSYGGLVAFEMAQQLSKGGDRAGLLVLLDTEPPCMPAAPVDEVELMMIFENLFCEEYGRPSSLTRSLLEPTSPEERLLQLKLSLERVEVLPEGNTITEVKGLFNVFKTNAQTRYQPQNVFPLPLHLFLAEDAPAEHQRRMIEGWSMLGETHVTYAPGTHTTMTYEPHVRILASKLAECLAAAELSPYQPAAKG